MPGDRIVIRHPDGRTFTVTREAHARLYPDFEELEVETPAVFSITGIPKGKRKRNRPRAKDAAPVVEPDTEGDEA